MVPSSDDMLAFVAELNGRRIDMVLNSRKQRLGGLDLFNERQVDLLATARKLHLRYSLGNYQHSETEVVAVNELGHWLLEEHAMNEGLPRVGTFPPLTDRSASRRCPLPAGRYEQYLWKVRHD